MPVLPPFDHVPEALARLLLIGGSGAGLVAARDMACAAGDAWSDLADALALAVWEDVPFGPEAVATLTARQEKRPFLPPLVARPLAAVAAGIRPTVPEPYFDRLVVRRDIPKILAYLLERQRKQPDDPGVLHRLASFAPMVGPAADTRAIAAVLAAAPGALAPFGAHMAGELALLGRRPAEAEVFLRRALSALPGAGTRQLLAEALWRQGGRDVAVMELASACQERPFDLLALSRLHDWATGMADRTLPLEGRVTVLLYSYKSAALLDRALAALAETDWTFAASGDATQLFVLDNCSGDDTASVLAGWRERLGSRLSVVPLPVNIGAPAARNWLAGLPEVRAADFAAYLDDDAFVPADWLGRFGAAVAERPEAGVWGSLVRGLTAPQYVQSADTHLLPTPRVTEEYGRAFGLARPWLTTADWGQYEICRPCASVTGCCHLFRLPVLTGLGGFDIRFSPSQYDDLDHDLRLLLTGRTPVFQGHLTVLHAKATGGVSNPGGAAYGSGFANQFKLHNKFDDGQIAAAAGTAFAALAEDAARKVRTLVGMGLIDGRQDREAGDCGR